MDTIDRSIEEGKHSRESFLLQVGYAFNRAYDCPTPVLVVPVVVYLTAPWASVNTG